MFYFTAKIGALISGAGSTQTSICNAVVQRTANDWSNEDIRVQDIADMFAQELANYRARHAEQVFLRPLGLDTATFMANQNSYQPKFVEDTIHNIQNLEIGEMQTIIMGMDKSGPHLFHIDKWGNIRCDDLIGFTAIGIGEWHATSYLMLAKYSRKLQFQTALLHMYLAKRKAEAAPGIGRTTDIFFISDHFITTLRDGVQDILKSCVDKMEAKIAPLAQKTEAEFRKKVDAFLAKENETPIEIEQPKPLTDVVESNPATTEQGNAEATTGTEAAG